MKVTIEFEMPSLPGLVEAGQEGTVIEELIRMDAFNWRVAHGLRATVEQKTADLPLLATLDRPGAVSKGVFDAPDLETSVGPRGHSVFRGAIAVDRPARATGIWLVCDAGRQAEITPLFRQGGRGERDEGDSKK